MAGQINSSEAINQLSSYKHHVPSVLIREIRWSLITTGL